jgi:enamine deaminase RidA (YjgF/YER057c/UK114 family)
MVEKEIVSVPGLAPTEALGFAQCVAAGDFVFVAGQTGIDEEWKLVSPDFDVQARKAFDNLRLALEAAGSSLDQIVTMTAFFADPRDIAAFSAIRREVMPGSLAASTAIGGASYVLPGILLEIEATAIRGPRG